MASTVYTESVVTLNATQAEATMNALKSSADDLRTKMIPRGNLWRRTGHPGRGVGSRIGGRI